MAFMDKYSRSRRSLIHEKIIKIKFLDKMYEDEKIKKFLVNNGAFLCLRFIYK